MGIPTKPRKTERIRKNAGNALRTTPQPRAPPGTGGRHHQSSTTAGDPETRSASHRLRVSAGHLDPAGQDSAVVCGSCRGPETRSAGHVMWCTPAESKPHLPPPLLPRSQAISGLGSGKTHKWSLERGPLPSGGPAQGFGLTAVRLPCWHPRPPQGPIAQVLVRRLGRHQKNMCS